MFWFPADLADIPRTRLRESAGFAGDKVNSNLLAIKQFIKTHIDRKAVSSKEDIAQLILNSTYGILISGIYPNDLRASYALGV